MPKRIEHMPKTTATRNFSGGYAEPENPDTDEPKPMSRFPPHIPGGVWQTGTRNDPGAVERKVVVMRGGGEPEIRSAGCGRIRVDGSQVGVGFEQMGGETVPQSVRMNFLADASASPLSCKPARRSWW